MSRSRLPHDVQPPLYARMLRLRTLTPSGFLCFIFLEGTIALGVLLALAELVSWWGVLVLPATVAGMVKLNDVVAGALTQPAPPPPRPRMAPIAEPAPPVEIVGETTTRLPGVLNRGAGAQVQRPWAERLEAEQQRVRQSASRRYE
ncbi:hypothetical protein [Paractinoplanes rishiriensis]|uniref:Uncharacterized protein n=1 Tax=Paractinoplanes rishiriensis TaxID=1050105 RepID=A0A919MYQ5_9ACTN|nr:hypothetical protein [Actinoplanes rishiriensis]GIF00225.1 hypothetical protein Ari01nite_76890 [Actinoplanes rishiriensis]